MLLAAAALGARAQVITNFPAPPVSSTGGPPTGLISAASASIRQGYDTNVFGVSTNPAGHPPVADVSSAFTVASAGVTLNLAPLVQQPGGFFNALTLAYQGDYTAFASVAHEDNLRNTLTLVATGRDGPWSASINNPLIYVDGPKDDPFFNTYNNLGYGPTRERRNQVQERNTSFVRYDGAGWFVRIADSLTYFNLLINEHDPVGAYKGYANWVNRDNINVGPDFGWKTSPDFAWVAGWRIGQQTQARPYYSLADSDNTYNRALFGFEGRLLSRVRVQLLAGPDFRRYGDGSNSGIDGDRHTWLYTEGQLAATLSPSDTLSYNEKVWHWVSSSGTSSIQETLQDFLFTHDFTPRLSASVGLNLTGHRYDAPQVRDDWTRSFPAGLTYSFNRRWTISAEYTDISGKSHLDPTVTPGQNFSDNTVSLLLKASY